MDIEVKRGEYADVVQLRDLFRHQAHCQIKCDSILRRELADPYLLFLDGVRVGYAGVWNTHWPGRLMEFYVLPQAREHATQLCRIAIEQSGATAMEAQTNIASMHTLLEAIAEPGTIVTENYLFADPADGGHRTDEPMAGEADAVIDTRSEARQPLVPPPGCTFRPITPGEFGQLFKHHLEPEGKWGVERDGVVIGTGGFLTHYNPPYADLFMEVKESARRQGVGAYLVQELRRITYQSGYLPASRCAVANVASRRTLERAGMVRCGRIVSATVAH